MANRPRQLAACLICGGFAVLIPGSKLRNRPSGPSSCGKPMDIVRFLGEYEDDFEAFALEVKAYVKLRTSITGKMDAIE